MITFKQFLEERDNEIYADKIEDAPSWSPAVAEHDYKIGDITFSSRRGLGSTPLNANIWHEGIVVFMRPSMFLKLAKDDEGHQEPTSKNLEALAKEGYAIGIPFLTFTVDEDGNDLPRITGHEGRGRMRMAMRMLNDEPIPVHMRIGNGLRSNYLVKNPEVIGEIKQGLYSESGALVKNPVTKVYLSPEGRYNTPGKEM